jgi:hypothetical protein
MTKSSIFYLNNRGSWFYIRYHGGEVAGKLRKLGADALNRLLGGAPPATVLPD